MTFEFCEPKPIALVGISPPRELSMAEYLEQVVLAQPYWRSSAEALEQAEELLDLVEAVQRGDRKNYTVRGATLDALRSEMKLVQAAVVQQNPALVRPSIRFGRVVFSAQKVAAE